MTLQSLPKNAHVELYRLQQGAAVLFARVELRGEKVHVESDDEAFAQELTDGITDPLTRRALRPADGWIFLATLASVYDSPYLYATNVISDD